jgi:hypothetical protein
MERVSREAWAKRVERWKDSGLTAAEYAAEIGVKSHTLSWWKWRLASAGEGHPVARPSRRRTSRHRAKTAAVSPLTFVEMTARSTAEALEVVLPTSIRIRVPPDFDAAALGRLLGVLEQRR